MVREGLLHALMMPADVPSFAATFSAAVLAARDPVCLMASSSTLFFLPAIKGSSPLPCHCQARAEPTPDKVQEVKMQIGTVWNGNLQDTLCLPDNRPASANAVTRRWATSLLDTLFNKSVKMA